jgi:hypothetical protein
MKSSLGNIYVNRNAIAHGNNASVSLRQLSNDYNNIKDVVDIIEVAVSKSNKYNEKV